MAEIMPTYDYECEKCGKSFEAFQSMKDKPFETCQQTTCGMPEWGEGKVRRLIGTGAGLIFKGSGFYITDYRSEGYKKAAQSESSAAAPAAPATTPAPTATTPAPAKTESKPSAPSTSS